jgi:hypothetical protein
MDVSVWKLAEEWKKELLPSWMVSFPTEFKETLEFSHNSSKKNPNYCPISLCIEKNLIFNIKVNNYLLVEMPEDLPKQITSIGQLKTCLSIIKQLKPCPGITASYPHLDKNDLPKRKDGTVAAIVEEDSVRSKE